MSEETAKLFKEQKYLFIKDFIDPDLAKLIKNYTLLQQQFFPHLEAENQQIPNTHSVYGDHMMDSLLGHTTPKMEELTGYQLFPTYTYYRVYKQGDTLKHHIDRASCEISATVCLGYDYSNLETFSGTDYNWKLWVNNTANAKAYGGDPEKDIGYDMEPGDAIVYKGTEVDHWREEFKGKMQSQVFFHYVDQNGPFGEVAKYDCRPALGYPHTMKDQSKVEQLRIIEQQLREGKK